MGYNGLDIPVRVDAKRRAFGRQNMYFSIFIGFPLWVMVYGLLLLGFMDCWRGKGVTRILRLRVHVRVFHTAMALVRFLFLS